MQKLVPINLLRVLETWFAIGSTCVKWCNYPHNADRQRVDVTFTVCLCVCMVTDFSGEDKANGVKFYMVV